MAQRHIEVFTTGCAGCEQTARLANAMAGPGCDVVVRGLRSDDEAATTATEYGISRVPAVVVDGRLAECCQGAHGADPGGPGRSRRRLLPL